MKLLPLIIVAVSLFTLQLSGKSTTRKFPRPTFFGKVNSLLDDMAEDNGYSWREKRNYHKCHIVPWNFMEQMIRQFNSKKLSSTTGVTLNVTLNFIEDLTTIHVDATFYKNLGGDTSKKLKDRVKDEREIALALLDQFFYLKTNKDIREQKYKLLKRLFNMPSNLFPGNAPSNMGIKDRFDPPRKDRKGSRSNAATTKAKDIFKKYQSNGLIGYNDKTYPAKIKSSDVEGNGEAYEKQKDPGIYIKIT